MTPFWNDKEDEEGTEAFTEENKTDFGQKI